MHATQTPTYMSWNKLIVLKLHLDSDLKSSAVSPKSFSHGTLRPSLYYPYYYLFVFLVTEIVDWKDVLHKHFDALKPSPKYFRKGILFVWQFLELDLGPGGCQAQGTLTQPHPLPLTKFDKDSTVQKLLFFCIEICISYSIFVCGTERWIDEFIISTLIPCVQVWSPWKHMVRWCLGWKIFLKSECICKDKGGSISGQREMANCVSDTEHNPDQSIRKPWDRLGRCCLGLYVPIWWCDEIFHRKCVMWKGVSMNLWLCLQE